MRISCGPGSQTRGAAPATRARASFVAALVAAALPIASAVAGAGGGAGPAGGAAVVPRPTVLHCGHALDVAARRIDADVGLRIEGGRIVASGPYAAIAAAAPGATVIDQSARWCLPGLMDMHVHLSLDSTRASFLTQQMTNSSAAEALLDLNRAQRMLHGGFTTIRVVGESDLQYSAIDVRNAIARGEFDGPRMLVAPHAWSETGGHSDYNDVQAGWPDVTGTVVRAGVDNVREVVREEKKRGADWIKICASGGVMSVGDDPRVQGFTDEEIAAFADEAHRLGLKITAHVHGNRAGLAVARAGFDSLEHGTLLEDDAIAMMKKNGVVYVPTRYVAEWVVGQAVGAGVSAENRAKAVSVVDHQRESILKAYRAGVKIALGSDPIFPVEESMREFAALVKVGLAPWDAIRAGTIVSAELLGLQAKIGTLEVGREADVVAVGGDPVADIAELERVRFVMKGGKVIRAD